MKPWTDEDSALLREVAESSHSLTEISKRTGKSLPTIRKWMRVLEIPLPDGRKTAVQPDRVWSDEKQEYLEKHASTTTLTEMAEALGVNTSTVRIKSRKSGATLKNGSGLVRTVWTDQQISDLQELIREMSIKDAAEVLGVSSKSASWAVQEYGLKSRGRAREWSDEERARVAATTKANTDAKYPPGGPWVCFQCKEILPLSEFPTYANDGHVCHRCLRLSRVERTYGISREQFLELFEAQEGKCARCRKEEWRAHPKTGRVYDLSVDHDHSCCPGKKSCGKCVRGLLCSRCNNMLGHFEASALDSGESLESFLEGLLAYIERSRT